VVRGGPRFFAGLSVPDGVRIYEITFSLSLALWASACKAETADSNKTRPVMSMLYAMRFSLRDQATISGAQSMRHP
jgi:hypothetical protein